MISRFALLALLLLFSANEKAPELRKAGDWFNTEAPLKLSDLKGRVVLIDFWAFDCDPCKETVPHIEAIYEKYSKEGLVVIGVHTPRLDYEHKVSKLREAIQKLGIHYPVVMDEKQKIWSDYRCDLWPTQFVIDRRGMIRLSHGGVGRYDEIEDSVRSALNEK